MERNKHLLLLLLVTLTFSCNNQQKNEKNNTTASDSVTIQHSDKAVVQDTTKSAGESNFVIASPTNSNATEQAREGTEPLSDIYKKLDKTPQIFLFETSKDTTIACKEGTSIKIKAKSFVSERTGKEITGNIQISVKEYYKLSDILLAKLSTTTNGNLLETAGMIYIAASAKNEKCVLKQGQTIEMGFRTKERKDDMRLYTGEWKNDYQINWELVPNSNDQNRIYSSIEQMPNYPGGEQKMLQFMNKSLKYPAKAKEKGIQGPVYISFVVGKDGRIDNARVVRSLDPECDQAALDAVKQMPKWNPGKINGEPVNVNFTLPVIFSFGDGSTYNIDYKKDFEKTYTDTSIKNAGVYQISSYLFSATELGWINCDRLWKDNNAPRVNYIVQLNSKENCNTNIVFHRFKAIMNGIQSCDFSSYANIPSGEQITLVAIKYINGKPYLAVKETQTSSQKEEALLFLPVTMETLKSEIKKLDRFN